MWVDAAVERGERAEAVPLVGVAGVVREGEVAQRGRSLPLQPAVECGTRRHRVLLRRCHPQRWTHVVQVCTRTQWGPRGAGGPWAGLPAYAYRKGYTGEGGVW